MHFKKKRKEVMSPFSRLIARIFLQKVSAWHTFKVKVSGGISQEGGGYKSGGIRNKMVGGCLVETSLHT